MVINGSTITKPLLVLLLCWNLGACNPIHVQPTQQIQHSRTYPTKISLSAKHGSKQQSQANFISILDHPYDSKHNTDNPDLWDELRNNMQFPDETHRPEVLRQIIWFQNNQKYFKRIITKSAPFIYYIYQQTQQRNMPSELAFLPIIESSYNPVAYSKAGAIGMWQMMPGTAALLGLKVNWWYDGRRDLTASTKAALDYLTNSDKTFAHDWLLSLASYNCGEGRVNAAITYNKKNNLPVDFWSLRLPRETKNYVPKFLAMAAIIKNPPRYGITLPAVNNAPYIEAVTIKSQIDLHQAARLAGVDIKTIRELNPGYLRFATTPDGPHELLLPTDKTDVFKQNLELLPEIEKIIWRDYHAKYGDSLEEIASKYNTDPIILQRVNNLTGDKINRKQHLFIPSNYHENAIDSLFKEEAPVIKEPAPQLQKPKAHIQHKKKHLYIYKITAGDTLEELALRFNSSIKAIIKANQLRTLRPKMGQIIKIPSGNNIL